MTFDQSSSAAADRRASAARRWWAAVGAGAIASLPLGWLLSYGAALMALLGLFFFALFGLVIGAVMCRVAAPARPILMSHIKAGVGVVVLICWSLSMAKEVHDFPIDKANYALASVSPLPEGTSPEGFKEDVKRFVRDTLTKECGSSETIGYARWTLTSSRMEYPVATMKKPIVLKSVQYKGWWAARVVLSVVLLSFGIYVQVAPLARVESRAPDAPRNGASDARDSNATEPGPRMSAPITTVVASD